MARNSLYTEVFNILAVNYQCPALAMQFKKDLHFSEQNNVVQQLHDINIYWMVECARVSEDTYPIRLCLEDFGNRHPEHLNAFVSEWLTNFQLIVAPFFIATLSPRS